MLTISLSMPLEMSLLAAPSAAAQSLDGVWRSQGYGSVFYIQGPALKAFEVTAATCLPGFTARRAGRTTSRVETIFKSSEGDIFHVKPGDRDRRILHFEGSASDIRIERLPGLPPVCNRFSANTPAENFEVFTRTWAEHYISFDLKRTDWDQVVALNRPRVTPATTPGQLFDIFEAMIRPFGDAHTFLQARKLKRNYRALRPGTDAAVHGDFEKFGKSGMKDLFAATARAHLKGPLRSFCNAQIEYRHAAASIGYLRIVSFGGYAKGGGFAKGLIALESTLDEIFSDPNLRALVIDVRINFGGADPYGLVIASRLATREYLAYTKHARADPVDRDKWTPGDASVVRPASRPGFHGPVVELIGPLTISAGETFTQGGFSDVLSRRLPNGWSFGLPNEIFRTYEGKTFDGPGIPPGIAVPVFAAADVAAGRDPAMAQALRIL